MEPFYIANASLSGQVLRIQISEAISLGNGAVGEANWKKLTPSIIITILSPKFSEIRLFTIDNSYCS